MTDTPTNPKAKSGKLGADQPDDSLTQSERFMKAARELGADDDPERFKERVRRIAKASAVPQGKSAQRE